MKFCPVCKARYDEEILRFCTKDGSPLIDENPPNFTEMPSATYNADELGEETVIRRNPKPNAKIPAPLPDDFEDESSAANVRNPQERIVIPTNEAVREPQIRTKTVVYDQKPRKSNTAKIVALTIIGTLAALTAVLGAFWALRSPSNGNLNVNVNTNPYNISANSLNANADNSFNFNLANNANAVSNVNANLGANANFNAGGNLNSNLGINFNLAKTPTPRPSATPTPRPSAAPVSNTNSITNTNSNTSPTPTPTPTPRISPTVSPRPSETPTPAPVNRPVNAGVLNGQALSLPKPAYPAPARAVRANGQVTVQVFLDENGTVTSVKALSGNPLLRQPAEAAARQSRFNPIRVAGQPVPATGVLIYNFIN